MKRERIPIPKPRSSFLLVRCPNCGNEQAVFSSPSEKIKCRVCEGVLVENTGGKGLISGTIIRRLD